MRVILNVESLVKPRSGIGRYTLHLLKGMLSADQSGASNTIQVDCFDGYRWYSGQEFLTLLTAREQDRKPRQNPLAKPPSDTGINKARIIALLRGLPFIYKGYAAYKVSRFKKRATGLTQAIYHEPNFVLKPFSGKAVTTIHDISHIHFPQYHPPERVVYLNKHLSNSIKQAEQIITVSEYVKKELIEHFNLSDKDITSIALGVDPAFKSRTKTESQAILRQYHLQYGQYLLFVATLEPRKNIEQMLDAYDQLDEELQVQYPLVLVGGDGWQNHSIRQKIHKLAKQGHIIRLGYVRDQHLPYLYSGARAFVFVPYYEGFGLPPLEAMASGVPVLTSNVSSLPEVVADVGLMVHPDDVAQMTQHLITLLTDDDWRVKAIDKGLTRARQFTWEACVQKTLQVYRRVAQ